MEENKELQKLKEEVETPNNKFIELTDEELEDAGGGEMLVINMYRCQKCGKSFFQRGNTSYVICKCGGSARRVSPMS